MTHPIDILARLGREAAAVSADTEQLITDQPDAIRRMILEQDAESLTAALGARAVMACAVAMPDGETPLTEDEPATPDESPEEDSPDVTRAA